MINAQDLRIGNIYNRKHGKGWTQTVMDCDIIGHIFSYSTAYALDDFEAIELTPEILRACGFNGTEAVHCYQKRLEDTLHYIYITLIAPENIFSIADKYSPEIKEVMVFTRPIVQHLHQLQNLYRDLTGTELIYKP